MRLNSLFESTREYQKKVADPAMMTWAEYERHLNPSDRSHPSEAYDHSLADLNRYGTEGFKRVIRRFIINGINFELRLSTNDRWRGMYVKHNAQGDIVRDENDRAVYMSREEVKEMIGVEDRFERHFAIKDVDNKVQVGRTQDEWGALLIMVAREYRNFGLGKILLEEYMKLYPNADSGGFTSNGYRVTKRFWEQQVRKYLASGFYSHLVRTGQISQAKVSEITNGLTERPVKRELNLAPATKDDWLIYVDEVGTTAYIYDKRIYEYADKDLLDEHWFEHWKDNLILGYVHVVDARHEFDTKPYIYRLYAKTDEIQKLLCYIMLHTYKGDSPLRFTKEDAQLLQRSPMARNVKFKPNPENKAEVLVTLRKKVFNWLALAKYERAYRKKRDKYDEMHNRIQEMAYAMGQSKGR